MCAIYMVNRIKGQSTEVGLDELVEFELSVLPALLLPPGLMEG